MADQQSDQAALSNAVKTFYTKNILKDFEARTVFYGEAPYRETIPRGISDTVQFTRYRKISPLFANNTDQFTATQMYLSSEVLSVTLNERDGYVQLSRKLSLVGISNPLTQAAKKVKSNAQRSLDILVRNNIGMCVADVANASSVNMDNLVIDGGSLASTGATAKVWSHDASAAGDRFPMYHNKTRVAQSALVETLGSSALTVKTLLHGVTVLAEKDVPPLSDGFYRFIAHPAAIYQLKTSSAYKGWVSPTSKSGMEERPFDEGVIGQTKIISTNLAYKYPLSGNTLADSSASMFCSLLFGDEAYGVADIAGQGGSRGFEFFLKESGNQSTNDPTNMIKQAAFSIFSAGKVLNKSAGIFILTTEL